MEAFTQSVDVLEERFTRLEMGDYYYDEVMNDPELKLDSQFQKVKGARNALPIFTGRAVADLPEYTRQVTRLSTIRANYRKYLARRFELGSPICGIAVEDPVPKHCPLKGQHVSFVLDGVAASVRLVQTYLNIHSEVLDCVFVFPKSSEMSLVGLTVRIGTRTIVASIKGIEVATKEFEDAREKGQTAAIASTAASKVTLEIANIPPRAECVVEIDCVQTARFTPSGVEFRYPLVFSPHYTPPGDTAPVETKETIAHRRIPYHIDAFNVCIPPNSPFSGVLVKGVKGASHTNEDGSVVYNAMAAFLPKKNIVIRASLRNPSLPVATVYQTDGLCVGLGMCPDFGTDAALDPAGNSNSSIIFLLDCSGSMGGTRIKSLRKVMDLILRSLPEQVRFEIIRFGTRHESLFNSLVCATPPNIETALGMISGINANMGGTNILQPLQTACAIDIAGSSRGIVRQVVLITDGQVSNVAQIATQIAENASNQRVHAIGISSEADEDLIVMASKVGNGKAIFIDEDEDMRVKVAEMTIAILVPAVTDITVTAYSRASEGPEGVERLTEMPFFTSPSPFPPLFMGETLVAAMFMPSIEDPTFDLIVSGFGATNANSLSAMALKRRYEALSSGARKKEEACTANTEWPTTVVISGTRGSQNVKWEIHLPEHIYQAKSVQNLVASLMLRDIDRPGSQIATALESAQIAQLSTVVSVWGGVLGKHTALVGVDSEALDDKKQPRQIMGVVKESVPVFSTGEVAGNRAPPRRLYGGGGGGGPMGAPMMAMRAPVMAPGMMMKMSREAPKRYSRQSMPAMAFSDMAPTPNMGMECEMVNQGMRDKFMTSDRGRSESATVVPAQSPLDAVINCRQTRDGLWSELPPELAPFFGDVSSPGVPAPVWNTALVIAYLQKHEAASKVLWHLLTSKSIRFHPELDGLIATAASRLV